VGCTIWQSILAVELATCVERMCGASTLWQVVLKDWDEIAS
jgi:hypothetical protein